MLFGGKIMDFPKQTFINRFLPKEKIYAHGVSGKIRQSIIDNVSRIVIANNFSSRTLNVESGEVFPEIMVFNIELKKQDFNLKILDTIDSQIFQYILFIMEFDGEYMPSIAYKERKGLDISVGKRFNGAWTHNPDIRVQGNNIDKIYENFINQVSCGKMSGTGRLKDKIENVINKEKLAKDIEKLELKMKRESQFNKKIELNSKLKKLKGQL